MATENTNENYINAFLEKIINATGSKEPIIKESDKQERFLLYPENMLVKELDSLADVPRRLIATVDVHDTDSFNSYLAAYGQERSVVFANVDLFKLTAYLDYHTDAETPSYCTHVLTYSAPLDPSMKTWKQLDGEFIGQRRFARFLEENAEDIVEPDAASVMEQAMNLEVIRKVSFRSAERLQNGTREYLYESQDEGKGKGKIVLPEELKLNLPVFLNGDKHDIRVFLRYDIDQDGQLFFKIDFHRWDEIRRTAFDQVIKNVAEGEFAPTIFSGVALLAGERL